MRSEIHSSMHSAIHLLVILCVKVNSMHMDIDIINVSGGISYINCKSFMSGKTKVVFHIL